MGINGLGHCQSGQGRHPNSLGEASRGKERPAWACLPLRLTKLRTAVNKSAEGTNDDEEGKVS